MDGIVYIQKDTLRGKEKTMSDKQILAWLKSKRNGAHTQYWNARKLVDELEALVQRREQ